MLVERQFITNSPKLQSEISEQLCLKKRDLNNCGSNVVRYSCFYLFNSLCNDSLIIVFTGMMIKPTKDINYFFVEFNSFLKSQRQMKICPVNIYIKVKCFECEEIFKTIFQLRLFLIHKSIRSCLIGF